MEKPVNHFLVKPEVDLTPQIRASDIIAPGNEGGLSTHKIWIPPNSEYPKHQHPSPHVLILLEGGGYLRCWESEEETHIRINAGDVFRTPENVPHQVGADERGMIVLAVSVDSKLLTDPKRMEILSE